ncbi:MAG TPA: pilus assembly protein [Clostridiales bacterium]|nr:pilus assembly protein [Clostridiales bacterium]
MTKEDKSKIRRLLVDGSYTVEISFIMPLVIFLFVLFIYMTFYLYDCIYIQNTAYEVINHSISKIKYPMLEDIEGYRKINYEKLNSNLWMNLIIKDYSHDIKYIEKQISENISGRLLLSKPDEIKVKIDSNFIEAKITTNSYINIPLLTQIKQIKKTVICKVNNHYPTKFIRRSDFILNIFKK